MRTKRKKKTRIGKINKDFYCSQKFWWLSVNVEKWQTSSCCAATPQKINLDWLKTNTGDLFNTPELQQERIMMLNNEPVDSCLKSCWAPEKQNLPSRRLTTHSNKLTHTSIDSTPEILNIQLGSQCNMTCVYCCKHYSSAWSQDILNNGTYNVVVNDDRFTINTTDKVLQQLSHNQISESATSKLLFQEIENISKTQNLKRIEISGGEPFLYNNLSEIINALPDNVDIMIFSGLGVDQGRFKKELSKISLKKNITVVISAENIESMYEFVRYGNTWARFIKNIEQLELQQITYEFHATVSNLTIFGLKQFTDYFKNKKITYQPVTDPDFLNISVMDEESKNNLRKQSIHWSVSDALDTDPTPEQYQNLKQYLLEFAKRRHLSLELFPESFVNWLSHE